MTDRELMQQALDALDSDNPDIQLRAATALRARLAQPEPELVLSKECYERGCAAYDDRVDEGVMVPKEKNSD